jgi:xylulokinase
MPVELLEADEGAAYGAGLLAGVGTGVWPSVDAACEETVRVAKTVQPDPSIAARMNMQYQEYGKLYPALHGVRHRV